MASMPTDFVVVSDEVQDGERFMEAHFDYADTRVELEGNTARVTPVRARYTFQTDKQVPKLGMMIVGLGGNNGSTLTASILANKNNVSWMTKEGKREPNYFGSITQASTVRLGTTKEGQDVFIPLGKLVPMVEPNDIVIGGWDINNADLAAACERAQVLPYDLQRQLHDDLAKITPLPSIYIPEFIAANQEERANNVLTGTKTELVEQIRKDIRDFKEANDLDKVIVIWSANTERFADIREGLNDTRENLLKSIEKDEEEISPSTLFAVACIQEKVAYINGSPQNTFVPGLIQYAEEEDVMIGGDDFKSGQTKFKSVLVDFLVTAGIKPLAITSYNHLGNNDGLNLSSAKQFRSKEISKSNVVDDMVASNPILYKAGEHPDHTVVIKYVPTVADSKRAMDEYVSEIFMGGHNTIVTHNTCEDSLLASPLILDLVILTEMMQRITYKTEEMEQFEHFHPVLSILSYLCKAPLVPNGTPVVNALFKQRAALENILRACVGLPSVNDMDLQYRHHPKHLAQLKA